MKATNTLPIGVFDSGMGGLTVLRALRQALPNESFIYLGDTARLPYGTKSTDTVVGYAKQMAGCLLSRGIKALVVACNTASASALEELQTSYPELPIFGVIEPGARASVANSQSQEILVLATETTTNATIYPDTIQQIRPEAIVKSQACGLFVALAEEGLVDGDIARDVIKHYLQDKYRPFDCVLLGCTHFPVLKQSLQDYLGDEVAIVDSATEVASTVKQALLEAKLAGNKHQPTQYLVTDLPERFSRIGEIFLGEAIPIERIHLVDGC